MNAPDYQAWNQALAQFFYNPSYAGRPVYLQVDSDSLRAIALHVGVEPDQAEETFVQALHSKLKPGRQNPFSEFTSAVWRWRSQIKNTPTTPPPFLGLLGICVLAASKMCTDPGRGVISSNYYVWLNELLGLKHQGMPAYFERVTALWPELNSWLDDTNNGSIGLSTAKTHSWFVNVGYPVSQCLLRNVDRQKLPDFFRWEGLNPGEDVSGEDLIPRLKLWATRTTCSLSEHGRRIFATKDNRLIRQAADVIAAELRLWNGGSIDTEGRRYATIELWLDVQRGGRRFSSELYPRAPEGFPEGVYQAGHQRVDLKLLPGMQWFESLPDVFLGETLEKGLLLRKGSYALQYKESPVIPLGSHLELGGWVSCGRVHLGERYLVLCHNDFREKVKEYLGKHAAAGWRQAPGTQGLPASWVCFQNVRIVAFAREYLEELDCLVPRLRVGIQLQGGLKLETDVWLKGGEPDALITTYEQEKIAISVDGRQVRVLPEGTGIVKLAELDLESGEHEIIAGTQRRRFHLCKSGYCPTRLSGTESLGFVLRQDGTTYHPTSLGPTLFTWPRTPGHTEISVVGARVVGLPRKSPDLLKEELVLSHGYKRYIVLGRRPGEIAVYHLESRWPYWYLKKYDHLQGEFKVQVPFEAQWVVKIGRKSKKHLSPVGIPASPESVIADPSLIDEWIRWASKRYHNVEKQSRYGALWEEYRNLANTLCDQETWTTTLS